MREKTLALLRLFIFVVKIISWSSLPVNNLKILLYLSIFTACAIHVKPAYAITMNNSWEYRATGGSDVESSDQVVQRYNLGTSLPLQWSDALSSDASIQYNRYQINGLRTNETLNPTASLTLSNDLFGTSLSGSYTEQTRSGAATQDTYYWTAQFSSQWSNEEKRELWPSINLYYTESDDSTDDDRLDNDDSATGASIQWETPLAELTYNFNKSESNDYVDKNTYEYLNHNVRIDTSGSFLGDRLFLDLSQAVDYTKSETTVFDNGFLASEIPSVNKFSALESDPQFNITSSPFTPLTVEFLETAQFGVDGVFDLNDEQQVNQLRLVVDDVTAAQIDAGNIDLVWDLYTRSSFDNNWELIGDDVTATYDAVKQWFVVEVPPLTSLALPLPSETYNFIKVLVANQSNNDVRFVSLQAIEITDESTSDKGTSYFTDISGRLTITPTLVASSSLNLTFGELNETQFLYSTLRWTPSPIISPGISYSEGRLTPQGDGDSKERIDRTYTISLPVNPIPTLSFTLTGSRSEIYFDSQRESQIDTYTMTTSALIYPDLTSDLALSYDTGYFGRKENQESGLVDDGTDTESFSGSLSFGAALYRNVRLQVTNSYSKTWQPIPDNVASTYINLSYAPTQFLSSRLQIDKTWTDDKTASYDFRADIAAVRTQVTRLDLNYRFRFEDAEEDRTRHDFGLNYSWDINQIFAVRSNANYRIDEDQDLWSLSMKLLMRI